jgi:hypothetical protein
MRFEARCSSGLGGTPPHLDLLAVGPKITGVESKCTEWMAAKKANFVASYDTLAKRWAGCPWFDVIAEIRKEPRRYSHLDAAQLVKHALGLKNCFPEATPTLLYLFWEPLNAADWGECAMHRAEIEDVRNRIHDCTVNLEAMSYPELWSAWNASHLPLKHLEHLRSRYLCVVPRA